MYTPAQDEKTATIIIYSETGLVRGDAVLKVMVPLVSVWMRTEAAPEYIHLLDPQVIVANNSSTKVMKYSEIYFPADQVLAYHLAPPANDPLDYDEGEANRTMQPVDLLVGPFIMKGSIRISTKVDMGTSIASSRSVWMSLYETKISNPYIPQMGGR